MPRHGEQGIVAQARFPGIGFWVGLVGHEKVDQVAAMSLYLRGPGFDFHVRFAHAYASSRQGALAHVHRAHPAHAHGIVSIVVAEHGNFDPCAFGGFVEGRSLGDADSDSIDGEFDHVSFPSPISTAVMRSPFSRPVRSGLFQHRDAFSRADRDARIFDLDSAIQAGHERGA